jgi:hypothetical protein
VNDADAALQELFRDAAQGAPGYDERKLEQRREGVSAPRAAPLVPPRRDRRVWLGAAAALVVGVVGATWWGVAHDGDGAGSATCASELRFDGRAYVADGALRHLPRAGERLGTGVEPGCRDGEGDGSPDERVAVYRLPGLPVAQAVLAQDMVWVRSGLGALPDKVVRMNRPLPCRSTTLRGQAVGYHGDVGEDARPPYALDIEADQGEGLPLEKFARVSLRLHVTDETTGRTDPAFVKSALATGSRITATVTCVRHRWLALSLR